MQSRLDELLGKTLATWGTPESCYGETLILLMKMKSINPPNEREGASRAVTDINFNVPKAPTSNENNIASLAGPRSRHGSKKRDVSIGAVSSSNMPVPPGSNPQVAFAIHRLTSRQLI